MEYKDYYKVLGVDKKASSQEIKKASTRLTRFWVTKISVKNTICSDQIIISKADKTSIRMRTILETSEDLVVSARILVRTLTQQVEVAEDSRTFSMRFSRVDKVAAEDFPIFSVDSKALEENHNQGKDTTQIFPFPYQISTMV